MTVTDTLARIDYALMVESNVAGAEWLLEEFDRGFEAYDNGLGKPRPYIRPMIELVGDHACVCEEFRKDPGASEWRWSIDSYHSCGDVICSQCERNVHELDARMFGGYGINYHAGYWFCLDCEPIPPLLAEEVS